MAEATEVQVWFAVPSSPGPRLLPATHPPGPWFSLGSRLRVSHGYDRDAGDGGARPSAKRVRQGGASVHSCWIRCGSTLPAHCQHWQGPHRVQRVSDPRSEIRLPQANSRTESGPCPSLAERRQPEALGPQASRRDSRPQQAHRRQGCPPRAGSAHGMWQTPGVWRWCGRHPVLLRARMPQRWARGPKAVAAAAHALAGSACSTGIAGRAPSSSPIALLARAAALWSGRCVCTSEPGRPGGESAQATERSRALAGVTLQIRRPPPGPC